MHKLHYLLKAVIMQNKGMYVGSQARNMFFYFLISVHTRRYSQHELSNHPVEFKGKELVTWSQ